MTKTTKHCRKVKHLTTPKLGRRRIDEVYGIPRPTIKLTEGHYPWRDYHRIKPSEQPKMLECAPRPPIRYPATWWDAVKARFVPTWVYGWGITEPTFIVHEL